MTCWEKIFVNYSSVKGVIYRILKELKTFNNETLHSPIKKWEKNLNRHFFKRRYTYGQQIHEK